LTAAAYNHGVSPASAQQIGPYPVLGLLGEGGMAIVYLARDGRHGRDVAIKVMKPDTAAAIGRERFLREIETIARLVHPHILPLYDSGSSDGQLYYVMPYIPGPSLHGRLRREGQLPVEEAIRIALGVASALGHAHASGLVHRDVKPSNILLSDGIPLVTDFGVARSAATVADADAETSAGTAPLTAIGMIVGTPQYMAPEQAFGDPTLDGRADLYALGCVLYEMLAGEPPFTGTPSIVLRRHAQEEVPPIVGKRPGLNDALVRVIDRTLAKKPAERFPTAAEFINALSSAADANRSVAVPGSPAAAPAECTIAVLPFENLGGPPEDTYLAEGICDELIHILGRMKGVRVTARTSSFSFRHRTADIKKIGTQLNVTSIIDGTLRRAGKRLRLSAELINVADGFQLWSERYDREVDDVFALQEDIAGAIAEALQTTLEGRARTPASNFEAYEHYVIGLHHWNRRSPQDLAKARDHLTTAMGLDPSFAPAAGALALCHVTFALYGLDAPAVVMPLARDAADRALGRDRHEPAARVARACIRAVHDWDAAGAEHDFRTVIAASPSNATARQWFATNLLAPLGRFDEARASLDGARELDPLSPSVIVSAGFVEFLAGDAERGIAHCERALSLDPAFSAARYFLGPMLMAAGRPNDAVEALETAAEATGRSPEVLAALATVYAGIGSRGKAEGLLADLAAAGRARFVSPGLTSMVRAALGDLDGAMSDMERAIDARAVEVIWIDVRPAYAPLRADPRFAALLARRDATRRLASSTGVRTAATGTPAPLPRPAG
jgi:serine/threonine-protein kinase